MKIPLSLLPLAGVLLFGGIAATASRADEPAPLVASYSMEPDPAHPGRLVDSGPLHCDGVLSGDASLVSGGHVGDALSIGGTGGKATIAPQPLLDRLGTSLTITAWVKPESWSDHGPWIISKRPTLAIGLGDNHLLYFNGYLGGDWVEGPWSGSVPPGEWTHIAVTYAAGGKWDLYTGGKMVASLKATLALWPTSADLIIGGPGFKGLIDDVHIYASSLDADQVAEDMAGTLPTRPATVADEPDVPYPIKAALVRFDQPIGFSQGYGKTRQTAVRVAGPDAVDWPAITLNGQPVFAQAGDQMIYLPLTGGGLFQAKNDTVIAPGNHWLRAENWRWGQQYVYTADRSARSWAMQYELWTFPVTIQGAGPQDVRDVSLSCEGREIYHGDGPVHSLTLLLPQNTTGKPYTLTVGGRGPVTFDVGLTPVTLGSPADIPIPLDTTVPGAGPAITIKNGATPFPNQKEWDADMVSMATALTPDAPVPPRSGSMAAYLGIDAPRSPLSVYAIALPAGMSGNFLTNSNAWPTVDDYAAALSDCGYDAAYEQIGANGLSDTLKFDNWMLALRSRGIRGGFAPDTTYHRPFLCDPNLTFYSYNLPDYHAPLYRELQIGLQRLQRFGNLDGASLGADNAGYVPYWDWAPPNPNRPWGEAMTSFMADGAVKVPVGPGLAPAKDYEVKASQKQFVDYIDSYNNAFEQYGYFAKAAKEVDPALALTTGSFGSSPGVGGRGGWPWASMPGDSMFESLPVMQAYDWNEMNGTSSVHESCLLDILRSYYPDKPLWAVIDDFSLHVSMQERERDWAMALTRGAQRLGEPWLAPTTGAKINTQRASEQKQMVALLHKYGGVYAATKPDATIGILYVQRQAISRPIVGGADADDATLMKGSQEGKVDEAWLMCHEAGWPARIVTPEELQRGLPPGIKALLLVGLNNFDDTWHWYDNLAVPLAAFIKAGGRIIADDETVCPVAASRPGLNVRAFIVQGDSFVNDDAMLTRNKDNATKLDSAMAKIARPDVYSTDPYAWAIPTTAGNTHYVTVVNEAKADGQSAVAPRIAHITWSGADPIYDIRLGRRITVAEASKVNFTEHSFQWYAVPSGPVIAPIVHVTASDGRFNSAIVTIGTATAPLTGIPVAITMTHNGETATVYTASGESATLPIPAVTGDSRDAGLYTVTATELLSGLSSSTTVKVNAAQLTLLPNQPRLVELAKSAALDAFAARQSIPLTIALTPDQQKDLKLATSIMTLAAYYRAKGRAVNVGLIAPGDVVVSLQPLTIISHYPQWMTKNVDLILLGSASNNLLIRDQARAMLLGDTGDTVPPGHALVQCVCSPFVGERNALNILAPDDNGIAMGVAALVHGGTHLPTRVGPEELK